MYLDLNSLSLTKLQISYMGELHILFF